MLPTVTGCTPWNEDETVGFVEKERVAYWFSFDRDRYVVKYGKGYVMAETTLLTHDFLKGKEEKKEEDTRNELAYLFAPEVKKMVELYEFVSLNTLAEMYALDSLPKVKFRISDSVSVNDMQYAPARLLIPDFPANYQSSLSTVNGEKALLHSKSIVDVEKKVDLYPLPLVSNLPPRVLDSSKVTLFDLDKNNHMFSASLPSECQTMYGNVAGQLIGLDWPWPPGGVSHMHRLSDAIRYSINTEGKMLYKKIREKKGTFSGLKETYLRVTLGESRGESPGIPYVLEIWPSKHGSPIHNHGNAFAVIKVLFGGLTIRVYNKHMKQFNPKESGDKYILSKFDVQAGDVTWISPNWYQTHKLWNGTDDFCATIQCYQYGKNDKLSWPYFDYIASTTVIKEFIPDSDYGFTEFHHKVMAEYLMMDT